MNIFPKAYFLNGSTLWPRTITFDLVESNLRPRFTANSLITVNDLEYCEFPRTIEPVITDLYILSQDYPFITYRLYPSPL